MRKQFNWKYFLIGLVAGVIVYGLGWVPASITTMFNSKKTGDK